MRVEKHIDCEYVKQFLKPRKKNIHKGDCGRILIVAGTEEMAGAAVLAGRGAIRSGSGLVHICTEKNIFPVIQISQPELICTTWDNVKSNLERFDAVAIGPGLGVNKRTEIIVRKVLSDFHKTVVLDADGLNTVSASSELQELLKERGSSVIITPHQGEAERLLGSIDLSGKTKEETGRLLVERYLCTVVVKGAETFVLSPFSEGMSNTTGNPGMATAGSGDVLTGIITSFAGQGIKPAEAAASGVFIHGLAGDKGAGICGEYGLTSGMIAENIPYAIKSITGK